ncbi:MAG: aminotransferase class V-fold PLP-dependent enzyme [Ignavibacteriales bacterium]|nr:aminotransferase class V-fold PLP-dependent enzyme [Ignavibacteriales bacterium]
MQSSREKLEFFPDNALQSIRSLFPHTAKGIVYFNHAATSPLSTRVTDTINRYLEERSYGKIETYTMDMQKVGETRSALQRLIRAESPERIAFTTNTSDALNIVASGLDWKAGDRVLLNELEFPANVYPYIHLRQLGVEIDTIKCSAGAITSEMIYEALKPQTRLVALSAVQFLTGFRADLATIGEICRHRGIIFAVDGIQAVGATEIDVQKMKIDALSAGSQKWQMGPHGIGFLYLTEELQARLHQKYLGWLGVYNPWNFFDYNQPLASSARRYEGGTLNIPGIWGLHASINTLLEYGVPKIQNHILALTQLLTDELQKIGGVKLISPAVPSERAGIVTIQLPGDVSPNAVFEGLQQRNIQIALREGKLRYSPHFYNTKEEIHTAIEATRECCLDPHNKNVTNEPSAYHH